MTTKSNLKLYYNFGSETIDFSKDSYNIKNAIDYKDIYNGTLSNPLCINSKNSYLGEACFLCMKDLMTPEEQFGTFTLPIINKPNGTSPETDMPKTISVYFWLNILKTVGTTDFMTIATFNINSNSYVLCHNNNNICVKVNSITPIAIGRLVINQARLLCIKIVMGKNVEIRVVDENISSAYNLINSNPTLQMPNNLTATNIIFGDTDKNKLVNQNNQSQTRWIQLISGKINSMK
jgi:hypothetical protein